MLSKTMMFSFWMKSTFIVVPLVIIVSGFQFYFNQRQRILQKGTELTISIGKLKADQIAAWRSELLSKAELIAASLFFSKSMARLLADPNDPNIMKAFHIHLDRLKTHYDLAKILVVDTKGRTQLSLNEKTSAPDMCIEILPVALHKNAPVFTELYIGKQNSIPYISVVVPISAPDQDGHLGAVILFINAARSLYPVVQSWPFPSKTANTLLVRRDGDSVLVLNNLRRQPNTALKLRIPLSRTEAPSVMAVLGREGLVESKDYRGIDVVSSIFAVPKSPWFIVTNQDAAEVYAEWRFKSVFLVIVFIGLILLIESIGWIYLKREKRIKHELQMTQVRVALIEYAVRHSSDEFITKALNDIGDLVDSPIGFYHFVESDPQILSLQNWSSRTTKEFCRFEGKPMHASFEQAGIWMDCARLKKPVIHNDYESLQHRQGMPAGHPEVIRELTIPIMRRNTLVAVVGFGNKPTDYDEKDIETVSSLSDLTYEVVQRKWAEEAFIATLSRKKALLEAIPDIIMEVDSHKVYIWANHAGIDFFGKDVIGKKADYYFEGEQKTYDVVKPVFSGSNNVIYVESWQRRKDGEKRLLAWWCRSLIDEQGMVTGAISSAKDITEQVQQASRLQQALKMESVGRLAGGVAHDYNNMLSVIIGYTELALDKVDASDPICDDLEEIFSAAKRSAEITRQLLAFARKQPVCPKVIDINKVVENMLKMLQRLIGEEIDLVWLPEHPLWPVKIDPVQIEQVLTNLCVNARDAIAEVGSITIETHTANFDEAFCNSHTGFIPGEFIQLTVSDDGCGMDKATLDNIFEPFFTTKKLDQGTGLGLATIYGVVKQSNGFVNVYSEPGNGTTFKIYWPRHMGEAKRIREKTDTDIPMSRGETVLLVEDEAMIRKMSLRMLEKLGYKVLVAATPKEALHIAAQNTDQIQMLITDVVMPEMNGRKLADQLHALYPDIRIIFMSGYTANLITHRGVLDDGVNFIQKPFSARELGIKIRTILDTE
jgi:PAS domain S-box-containing protein